MTPKRFLRLLAPPILTETYRRWKEQQPVGPVWRGIYARLEDVPAHGVGFEGDHWARLTNEYTQSVARESFDSRAIPVLNGSDALLPLLVGVLAAAAPHESVRVLDFGGGLGIGFLRTLAATRLAVDYHIIETAGVAARSNNISELSGKIVFHTSLPPLDLTPRVVYIGSALQYINDYPDLVAKLTRYGAEYILFSNTSAGRIPTFASAQRNVKGSQIPYWFFDIDEIEALVSAGGYDCVFRSADERALDTSSLPDGYRLRHAVNLLFRRRVQAVGGAFASVQ